MKIFLDTNVLVDALRGHPPAVLFMEKLEPGRLFCSVVTLTELRAGLRREAAEHVDRLLSRFEKVGVDEETALVAGDYLRLFSAKHGTDLADALIAASAKSIGATLYTRNLKHFPMNDLPVEAPFR